MTADEAAPPGVDISTPSIARVYDFMVGGKDHFAVDRMAAQRALEIMPDAQEAGRACRAFLRRVVRFLAADAGVRQFLDIGSGLPTETNVHQVAHAVDPEARVVYADIDPMVLVHGRALLAGDDTTALIEADIRSPEGILGHPVVRERLDFTQPVGLLLFSILHHLHDTEDPGAIAATLRDALPPGSYLAIIHFWDPGMSTPRRQ
ncbi:SAM-dependent methyltransferase [Actinoplanes sp. GCM10030250]|uniref:SAM-dependent methyltransferase n=1 Tax=Actinoplanes sp. GCM10030250 TaxID=3273376 RepID=UPI00360E150B